MLKVQDSYKSSELTFEIFKLHAERHSYIEVRKSKFFPKGLIIDGTTIHRLIKIHDAVKDDTKKIIEDKIAKGGVHLAQILDSVWRV